MDLDIETLIERVKESNLDISGMSFEDAYEEVFSYLTDLFAVSGTPIEGDILYKIQDATNKYLEDKKLTESKLKEDVGDLPPGYSEEDFYEEFMKHQNDSYNIDYDEDDFGPTEDEKAKMAQYISVHGAPDYNGHQWFKTLHGKDAEDFGDDDFEEAANLGIQIDYSYDTITLTFPDGYDDVYPECTPASPYEGRDEYKESLVKDFFSKKGE